MTSLLESEGWVIMKTTSRGGCNCPHCGTEVRQNAFSRKKHKDRCEGWRRTETPSPAEKKAVEKARRYSSDSQAERDEELGAFLSSNPTPPPAPRLPWIEYRNGSWNEWDVTFSPKGEPRTYLRIREMSECSGGNRYSTYAGSKYIGAFSTLAIAQGSVERLVGVGK